MGAPTLKTFSVFSVGPQRDALCMGAPCCLHWEIWFFHLTWAQPAYPLGLGRQGFAGILGASGSPGKLVWFAIFASVFC